MAGGKQKQPTVSTDAVAHDQLRAFVERILRMREEAKSINDDVREIYAEAKGNGFDKTVLGQIVSHIEKRAKDPDTLAERSALFDLYLTAFDGGSGHAYARASSVPDHEPALTNTTADGEDGAGASVLATQSLPERNGGDNAAQGAATSLAGAEGDADRQLNTTIIRFAPKDDNRPRSSEGLPRPYGCKSVDACATTWRAEQPCTLCRAEIAIEVGGVSIPHHGEVA